MFNTLLRLTSKPAPQRATPPARELSREQCRQVAGGGGRTCYYTYSSGSDSTYTSNGGGKSG